jgi:hypothetical protein
MLVQLFAVLGALLTHINLLLAAWCDLRLQV